MTVVNMAKQEESTDIDINNYSEEPWSLIESYFSGQHLRQ